MPSWWPAVGVAVAFALLAALLVVLVVRRRRQRLAPLRRRHGAQLKFPLVLAHGILGFDELKLGPFRGQYFRGVAPRLEKLGTRMEQFKREVPDQEGIFYGSWLAKASFLMINPLLLPTWQLLRLKAGDNDGLVPVSSQQWGETCGTIEADHWGQVG